jgi:hypothetical protein
LAIFIPLFGLETREWNYEKTLLSPQEKRMTLLRIQMTDGQIARESFLQDRILGGRATLDFLLTQYGDPSAHPLSAKSAFIIAPVTFYETINIAQHP